MNRRSDPAFPVNDTVIDGKSFEPEYTGITMRDYFAAKAMQSFLTAAGINKAGVPGVNNFEYFIAEMAYKLADAMLRAREAP